MEPIAHIRKSDHELQSVEEHLNDVAALAASFADKLNIGDAGRIIGLLHDFGKYSQQFQQYIGSATGWIDPDEDDYVDAKSQRGKVDHSSAGAQLIYRELSRFGGSGQGEICAQILALCVASHHSGLIDSLALDGDNTFAKRMDKPFDKTHLPECERNADNRIVQLAIGLLSQNTVGVLFGRLREIIDFQSAARNNGELSKPDAFSLGFFTRFLFSCLIDADRLNSAEFEEPERKRYREKQAKCFNWQVAIDRLELKLAAFRGDKPIDKIRRQISNTCLNRACDQQGCYTLTVPTGGGKTLTSLRYAIHHAKHHRLERIIYIIPYTSIIEQNAQAVREVLEQAGDEFPWVLEHHSNIEPEKQTWHSKLAVENWDAPIVFTTMVQFLETLFSGGTRGVRRLHQLANSVLIFDEIQTLPINCTHLFCNALNFLTQHSRTTAVLCTATQPVLDRLRSPENGQLKLSDHYELVDAELLSQSLRRVDVVNECRVGGWSEQDIIERVIERFNQTKSCLVIVNTKDWAQRIYVNCRASVDSGALFHLSTNQYPAHRKKLLGDIKNRLDQGLPVLCISTQLIEAGVDVDFATVIRFLAGLDSIAQAAGRCNRNGKLKDATGGYVRGQVSVINPRDEPIDILVDIKEGQRNSERIFAEVASDQLLTPSVLSRYFDYFFFERSKDMTYPLPKQATTMLSLLANNSTNNGAKNSQRVKQRKLPLLQHSFMAAGKAFKAIDAPTQSVIAAHGDGIALVTRLCALAKEYDAKTYYQTLKLAQAYSVNVFPNVWQMLLEAEAVVETQQGEGIYYLKSEFYSKEFGLSTQACSLFNELIC
ncbi:CRISPR-associated helicase Cas3' [Agarivorans sp. Z349TD_8]|uniref:CRISPR-associated helicase Cas3' n=1 Tax=Agarivorans sp. Z349TD_8 TaxID=3421434 RepID=UPI003D7F0691